ncbi:MAG: gamma-glutamyltransferase [Gammaproteobacteria bacterium]|nr:gamma-glutamyltransferase [Gammaproteobacteria bacterium]
MQNLHRLLLILLLIPTLAFATAPGKSAVATAHALATEAGQQILAMGGNAFDAAVTVSAVLAVVEPYSSGLGGGGFWLLHRKDGHEVVVDGRETAPGKSYRDMYLDEKGDIIPGLSMNGPLAAGIPGEPAALAHISSQYGKLPLSKTLAPAIWLAREGFEVTPHYRKMAGWRKDALNASPEAAAIFLHEREVPALGQKIRQPQLAATLEALAAEGHNGFYRGEVAQKMVDSVQRAGGIWTLEDLAGYRIIERKPLKGIYGDYTITSVPPPSSGGVALISMLNMLQQLGFAEANELERTHLLVEVMRRAYRDRAHYLGDSDFVDVPVTRLTSPDHAKQLTANIEPERATPSSTLPSYGADYSTLGGGNDTTHFSILDREGNYVSATLSINYPFGSGFIAGNSGVLLNDEMDDFSAKPGVPNAYGLVGAENNAIAPGKRMLSSMSPSFVGGPRGTAILGTPGGSRIITMVLLGMLEFIDGKGVDGWVVRPRIHHQYLPDTLFYEPEALNSAEIAELKKLGHHLKQSNSSWGNMQAIFWDQKSGKVEAASDPRVEGVARVEGAAVVH